jgi:hypothetical protein
MDVPTADPAPPAATGATATSAAAKHNAHQVLVRASSGRFLDGLEPASRPTVMAAMMSPLVWASPPLRLHAAWQPPDLIRRSTTTSAWG